MKDKSFWKSEDAIIGGVIYMIMIIGIAIVLAFALMPAMDALLEVASADLQPVEGSSESWTKMGEHTEGLIRFWYQIFLVFAISAILYAILTPLKRQLYDKFRREREEW